MTYKSKIMLGITTLCIAACATAQVSTSTAQAGTQKKTIEICTSSGCRTVNPLSKAAMRPDKPETPPKTILVYRGESIEALEAAAKAGDGDAAYKAGSVYLDGLAGREVDYERALTLFAYGADRGHPESARGAALSILRSGLSNSEAEDADSGEDDDTGADELDGAEKPAPAENIIVDTRPKLAPEAATRMIGYLFTAAEGGDRKGMLELGRQYYLGHFVGKEPTLASGWFESAAKQGSADASYFLGQMYFRGQGKRQSSYDGIRLTKQAAERGSILAQRSLGQLYINGYQSIAPDPYAAERWLTAATRNGDPTSAQLLHLLRSGDYVPGTEAVTALLAPRDIVAASEAAIKSIEEANRRLAAGLLPVPTSTDWPDFDGDGRPDGRSIAMPGDNPDCLTVEFVSPNLGSIRETHDTVCRDGNGGGYRSAI